MATVIAVRFQKAGKLYYFSPNDIWVNPGDSVIVETVRGIELGEVITGAREVPDESIVAPLKSVLRMATEEDFRRVEANRKNEKTAFALCVEKIAARKLEMKLVNVEYTFDNSKVIFYFTANGRVDFRELVKDLASVLKTRIELRQIGVRDEAKMLGGLGSCGRQICCGAFLNDFHPVSIKMAKEQNLSLNPTKISGQCGRLMCCLQYEQENYESTLKKLPRVGREVETPDGLGIITEINVIREKVRVRVRMPDDSYDSREYSIDDVRRPEPRPHESAPSEAAAKPRPPKPQKAEQAEPEAEAKPERRKYPRQKAPKNLSTDQYIQRERERAQERADGKPGAPKSDAPKPDAPKQDRPRPNAPRPDMAKPAPKPDAPKLDAGE